MSTLDAEIRQIVTELCATATHTEGIFRKSGNMKVMKTQPYEAFGIHEKATRLKQCLKEIHGHLIGKRLTKKLLKLAQKESMDSLMKVLSKKLPDDRTETFAFVIHLLRQIADNESVTLMGSRNLSTCLTPTLFDVSLNKLKDENTYRLLDLMICHPKEIIPRFEAYAEKMTSDVVKLGEGAGQETNGATENNKKRGEMTLEDQTAVSSLSPSTTTPHPKKSHSAVDLVPDSPKESHSSEVKDLDLSILWRGIEELGEICKKIPKIIAK